MKLIPFRADILQVEVSQASFQRIVRHLPTQSTSRLCHVRLVVSMK